MQIENFSQGLISSNKVEGTKVFNTAGDKLGSIESVMIEKTSGTVRYAVLEFGGFLGMGTDRYPLPWGIMKYDQRQDGYVVPIDKNVLKDAPKYPENEYPEYNEEYGRRIYDYYQQPWYF